MTDRRIGAFSRIWIIWILWEVTPLQKYTKRYSILFTIRKWILVTTCTRKKNISTVKTIFIEAVRVVLHCTQRSEWWILVKTDYWSWSSVLYKIFTMFNLVYKTVTVKFNGWQSLWEARGGKSITMLRNVQPINQFLIPAPFLHFSWHVQRSMGISIKVNNLWRATNQLISRLASWPM